MTPPYQNSRRVTRSINKLRLSLDSAKGVLSGRLGENTAIRVSDHGVTGVGGREQHTHNNYAHDGVSLYIG